MKLRRSYFVMAVVAAALGSYLLNLLPWFRDLENAFYDVRVQFAAEGRRDPRIMVVGIDEKSEKDLGPFPWPRSVYGRLLRNLHARGARAVFFDLLFTDPGSAGASDDEEFARALRDTGVGVLGCRVDLAGATQQLSPPHLLPLLEEAALMGSINRRWDRDSTVRWGILAVGGPGLDAPVPSAALQLYAAERGAKAEDIRFEPGRVIVGDLSIPTTGPGANEVPVVFRLSFPPVPFSEVLAAPTDRRDLEGMLVLVGEASSDRNVDYLTTPFGRMKGVEIHAALLDTLLSGRIVRRAPIWTGLPLALLLALLAGLVMQRFTQVGVGVLAPVAVGGLYVVGNAAALKAGWWLSLSTPLVAVLLVPLTVGAARYVQARALFGQFVAGRKVDEMLLSDEAAELGGEEQVATVFFTDIRGYTTLSESRRPVEVMDILNQYHSRVGEIYDRRGGQVMTYQGDAQIVLFGYHRMRRGLRRGDAVLSAVQAGLEMQAAVAELRKKWNLTEGERFEVGVGICTGMVSVAVVGAAGHKQHTVLGEVVRMASEVQGKSAELDAPVLVDEASMREAEGRIEADALDPVPIKGQPEPVRLYRATRVR